MSEEVWYVSKRYRDAERMRISRLWTDENGVRCVSLESEDGKRGTAMPLHIFKTNYGKR